MIDRDRIVGGFNGALRSQMSPQIQRRLAEEEVREAREAAQEERERAQRVEDFQTRALQGAIAAAIERGEEVSPRVLRGRGEQLGHTPSEFVALVSAQQDREDAMAQARQQVAYRKWLVEQSDALSGDTSVHTVEAQRAEEQKREEQRHRNQVQRGRAIRRERIVQEARKAALGDTTKAIYAVERMRSRY
jgi:hypothetical protein